MIPNEKVINCEVVELIEMYKFCFRHFSIPLYLNNSKFKFKIFELGNGRRQMICDV